MENETRRLTVLLDAGPDGDRQELATLAGQLRRELLELDIDTVEVPRTDDVPDGAKSLDAVSIGALVLTLGPGVLRTSSQWSNAGLNTVHCEA